MEAPKRPTEFDLIADVFAPLSAGHPGSFGLTDDAAVFDLAPGTQGVVTMDTLIEGVHFLKNTSPDSIAARVLGVNLSDLASMGAVPSIYFLSIALPEKLQDINWLSSFSHGLSSEQARYGIHLAGGDTVMTPGPLSITIAAHGAVPQNKALRRAGASEGDIVCVSATIGDAALGLACQKGSLADLSGADRAFLVDRFDFPKPRLALGQALVGIASAGVDISDGLAADIGHICEASGVGAEILIDDIPLSAAGIAAKGLEPGLAQDAVLSGGDDYELAICVAPDQLADALQAAAAVDTALTPIGRIVEAPGVRVKNGQGGVLSLNKAGYSHF